MRIPTSEGAGTRPPMITGYALLAVGGVLLAIGGFQFNYWFVLPGLLAYGRRTSSRPHRQRPGQPERRA